MFEKFKAMLEAAEKIGTISTATVHIDSDIWGTRADVAGVDANGAKFHMEAWVDKEPAHE